jgi:hypothetical protein
VDSLIYQVYKRISDLSVGLAIALNTDDEFFIINNHKVNFDFDDKFTQRFNNWCVGKKKECRIKRINQVYIGYKGGDLCLSK